jgi:ATP-dependent helicase HrpB
LPVAAQDRALAPVTRGRRKIVLSTSVAETSLTIDGVDAVVDSGWSRHARFDPRRAMGGLVTTRVSQASAEQRRGRAGRIAPGRCYRLWSAVEHQRLAAHDPPDILTADHVPLALDLVRWGDPDGTSLRWMDAPPTGALRAARGVLRELDLVDEHDRMTPHGRAAAELPLHPRLAHALLRADELGHGRIACDVVALLGERDPGRHLGTVDLHERVRRIDGQAARQSARLARTVGATKETDAVGLVVALAHPERIARRRAATNRYLTAGGTGAELDPHDPLVRSEWIAIADLDLRPGGGDARVLLAAALDREDVDLVAGANITNVDVVQWDRQLGDVRAEGQRRLGSIVLASTPIDNPDSTTALLDGVRAEGLAMLPRWIETESFRERVAFCRRVLGEGWPDLSETTLLDNLEMWLPPWLGGAQRRRDLARVDVGSALRVLVPAQLLSRLDVVAPREIRLPSGRPRNVDYAGDEPTLAVRLQDAFGWDDTPRIADGHVPVVLQLLSPAGRPVQITSDLAGFWRGSYARVRAEMRGRYPKHAWPEDPTASAGA